MDKKQRLNKIPEIIQIYAEEILREWELFLIWNKHIFSTLYSRAIIQKKKIFQKEVFKNWPQR